MKQFLYPADILLPKGEYDKWAVIACDQYTSDKEYWEDVENIVGSAPSTLNLILPEIYLGETDSRVEKINKTMADYLKDNVFNTIKDSMVYIEREITGGGIRKGVLGLIDLAEYDYNPGSSALTRATEQTVAQRIPPRVRIRKDAPLEFPHILLFIDDPEDKVISFDKTELETLYNFDLMKKGGHIEGYRLEKAHQSKVNENLAELVREGLLFAVGDGNHSLATAKECCNLSKNPAARFALVEVVNIHNPAIEFEPIYRVLFGVKTDEIITYLNKRNSVETGDKTHNFTVVDKNGEVELQLVPTSKLPVGTLQGYLDDYLAQHPEIEIDYIHGVDATRKLCEADNTVGFLFDGMGKDELFDAVIQDGSLPRKTFSMGHADDKRFYIEGRKIK